MYVGFILWLFEGLRASQLNKEKTELADYPFVSIIVSARNEEDTIETLLNHLYQQSYPHDKFEIIIANDRSCDNTESILNKHSQIAQNMSFVTISETPIGWAPKKWALHTIIQQTSGEILLQTDADCIPHPQWIETMVHVFSKENIGMVSAPAPLTSTNSTLNTLYELDSLSQDGFSAAGFAHNLTFSCTGRNLAIRKSAFVEIDGYEGIEYFVSGDDDLLLQKLSSKTDYEIQFILDQKAVVESPGPKSIHQFINQRLRFASKGLDYYKIATSKSLKLVLPLIFTTNLLVVLSIVQFTETALIIWFLPWLIKSIPDALLTSYVFTILKRKWSTSLFILLSVIHPFYIIIFGSIGPFKAIKWKNETTS